MGKKGRGKFAPRGVGGRTRGRRERARRRRGKRKSRRRRGAADVGVEERESVAIGDQWESEELYECCRGRKRRRRRRR